MFKKIIYFFILHIIISKISAVTELPQYGKVSVYGQSYVYLDLDGFEFGDKINLQVSFNNGYKLVNNRLSIYYVETDDYSKTSGLSSYSSESYYISGYDHTFYYTITLKENCNYLVIRSPKITYSSSSEEVSTLYTIEHTSSNVLLIVIVIIVIIIIGIASFFIFRYVRRKSQEALIQPTIPNQPAYVPPPSVPQAQPAYVQPPSVPQAQPGNYQYGY